MIQIILWFYLECLKIFLSYNLDLLYIQEPELKCIGCDGIYHNKCNSCEVKKFKGTLFDVFDGGSKNVK